MESSSTSTPFEKVFKHDYEIKLSAWKLILMCLTALMLCLLGPISFLAPVPFVLAITFYGRTKPFITFMGIFVVLLIASTQFDFLPSGVAITFLVTYGIGVLIGEIFKRKMNPKEGMIKVGLALVAILFLITAAFFVLQEKSLNELVSYQVLGLVEQVKGEVGKFQGAQARELNRFIENPDLIVGNILKWSPGFILVSIFLVVWINIFVVLRNLGLAVALIKYPFSLRNFLSFRVSEYLVWPLIISLLLAVGGNYVFGEIGEVIGKNFLFVFGVFYFFQGFGVLSAMFDYLNFFGIFRSILSIMAFFLGYEILALIGLFDVWVNFRKFFKKENNTN